MTCKRFIYMFCSLNILSENISSRTCVLFNSVKLSFAIISGKHPVSLLGEYCSKKKLGPPAYELCFECGPDHRKNFLFKVSNVITN